MHETTATLLKSFIMAAVMTTFGLYQGAALIAFIAALSRVAYTSEQTSFRLFGRFFIMSLSITMLMVHIGKLSGWSDDVVIIFSGITAFLCREFLEAIVASKDIIIKRVIGVFSK